MLPLLITTLLCGCAVRSDSNGFKLAGYLPPQLQFDRLEVVDVSNVGMKVRVGMSKLSDYADSSDDPPLLAHSAKYRMKIDGVTVARGEATTTNLETGGIYLKYPIAMEYVYIRWEDLSKVRDAVRQGNGKCSFNFTGKVYFGIPDAVVGGDVVSQFDLLVRDGLDLRPPLLSLKDRAGAAKIMAADLGIN